MRAHCYRSGVIGFGRTVPEGAIQIAHGRARMLRKLVSALARHAYDGKTLLVPGIPEERDDDKAADALGVFIDRVKTGLALRRGRHG